MRWSPLLALPLAGALACATGQAENDADASTPADGGRSVDAATAVDAAPPDAAAIPCVEGNVNMVDPASGICYMLFNAGGTWNQASAGCNAAGNGAHLVTILSAAENTFVRSITTGVFYIGAADVATEGTFLWVTGEAINATFSRWDGGEPNNNNGNEDCAEMRDNDTWNDTDCTDARRYVCKRP